MSFRHHRSRAYLQPGVWSMVLCLAVLAGRQVCGEGPANRGTTGTAVSAPAAAGEVLFAQRCQRCHGSDGKGRNAAAAPDFTSGPWHEERSDIQLVVSILEGKGTGMPAFDQSLKRADARNLVAYIRTLDPAHSTRAAKRLPSPEAADFEARFDRLQKQYEELAAELRKLDAPKKDTSSRPARRTSTATPPAAPARTAGTLYRQHCARCHGNDGRSPANRTPDFTSVSWHDQHTDAQVMRSIVDGTEQGMPSFRRRLSESEARGLVVYIRDFASSRTEGP
jgi:mono/diheme cytochrome c family protein